MGARQRLHEYFDKRERQLAADAAAVMADGIADLLDALADDAQLDAEVSRSAAVIAATYRDAADRSRLAGVEIAETIRR